MFRGIVDAKRRTASGSRNGETRDAAAGFRKRRIRAGERGGSRRPGAASRFWDGFLDSESFALAYDSGAVTSTRVPSPAVERIDRLPPR